MGANQLVKPVSMIPSSSTITTNCAPHFIMTYNVKVTISLSSKLPFSISTIDAFHWTLVYFSFRIIEIHWIAEICCILAVNKSYLKMVKCPNRRNYFTFFHCTYKTSVRLSGISVPLLRSIVEYISSFSDDLSWLEVKFRDALNHFECFCLQIKSLWFAKNGVSGNLHCIKRDKEDDLLALKHLLLCFGTSIISDGIFFQKQ